MTYTHCCPQHHVIIEGPYEIEFKYCWKCGRQMMKDKNYAIQKQSTDEISVRERARSGERIRGKNKQEADEEFAC